MSVVVVKSAPQNPLSAHTRLWQKVALGFVAGHCGGWRTKKVSAPGWLASKDSSPASPVISNSTNFTSGTILSDALEEI